MNKYEMFDKLLEGVQVIDRNMRYLYLNEIVANQSKSTIGELVGNKMTDKFPSLKGSEVYSKIEDCMETGISSTMLNEFLHNDGSKGWFELRIEPIDDGVIIFSFDVTSQKLLEDKLTHLNIEFEKKANEKVEELEKCLTQQKELNDYKSKFVSIASHQFRTPLTSIILSASMVEQYGTELMEKEKMVSHFSRIKSSANHLVSVLNDFLSFEELNSGKFRFTPDTLDFYAFAQSIIDSVEPLLKEGQSIQLKVVPIPCNVSIDKELTHGVLLNLLSNAIKYSPEGALITLKAFMGEEFFMFEVIDEGIGIPEQEQHKLFNQFYRASNAKNQQGTGLGLNIVKQFVEKAGGDISFVSKEGVGTRFSVRFPQTQL